jgi:hypothetical protein
MDSYMATLVLAKAQDLIRSYARKRYMASAGSPATLLAFSLSLAPELTLRGGEECLDHPPHPVAHRGCSIAVPEGEGRLFY